MESNFLGDDERVAALCALNMLLPVTTSIRIAWAHGEQALAKSLSEDADAALYRAKAAGRNRFELANAQPVPALQDARRLAAIG